MSEKQNKKEPTEKKEPVTEVSTLPSDLKKRAKSELQAMQFKKGSIVDLCVKTILSGGDRAKAEEAIKKIWTGANAYSSATINAQYQRSRTYLKAIGKLPEPKKEA